MKRLINSLPRIIEGIIAAQWRFHSQGQTATQPTGLRLVRSPPESRRGQPTWAGQLARANNRRKSCLSRAHCVNGGTWLFSPPYFISVAVTDTQASSAVAVLRGKHRMMLVVQHHGQPVQWLVAKTYGFDDRPRKRVR
jgi:hypothetical protein